MDFSTFAKILYPVYADGMTKPGFVRELLDNITDFSTVPQYEPIENLSKETLKSYWKGRWEKGGRDITGLAPKIIKYIDVNLFIDFLSESRPNVDAIDSLAEKLEPYLDKTIAPAFFEERVASLFKNILLEAAMPKRTKGTDERTSSREEPAQPKPKVTFRKLRVSPISQNKLIPRPELISALREVHRHGRIAFVRGLPGMGKSELARHYAAESDFKYVLPMELAVDGSGTWERLVEEIELSGVSVAEDQKKIDEKKKDLLVEAGPETLLILDNFNSLEQMSLLRTLLQETGDARILITSQLGTDALIDMCACEVVDLEQITSSQKEAFCARVFCSHAGIDTPNLAVFELCSLIGNHTLTAALLGTQLRKNRKFGDTVEALLNELKSSVRKALSRDESIRVHLDRNREEISGDPYTILQRVFCNVLAIDFFNPAMRRHRQVLSAIIFLQREFHRPEVIIEMVGDINQCREARNAVIWLEETGILQIDGDDRLVLHPLLCSLFTDSSLSSDGSVIAEMSVSFLFHLLRNAFVSENSELAKVPETLAFYQNRRYGIDLSKIKDDFDCSWAVHWNPLEGYSNKDIQRIRRAINSNHEYLNIPSRITTAELVELLVPRPPYYRMKRNGLFFCVEHETGRSLWLSDYTTKTDWCVLNCSQQREEAFRYYDGPVKREQNSRSLEAAFAGFTWEQAPCNLCFPQAVYGAPLTRIKNALGNKEMHLVCFPPSVKEIEDNAFRKSPKLLCSVFTGESGIIGKEAFLGCPELMALILPRRSTHIGCLAFSQCPRLKSAAVSLGTKGEVQNADSFLFAAADIMDDSGLYYQGEFAYNMRELLLAKDDEEFLDITGTRPVDYGQFVLDTLSAKPKWEQREFRFGTDVIVDSTGNLVATEEYLRDVWSISEAHANLEFPFDKACKIELYDQQPIPADGEPVGWKDVWAFLKLCSRNFKKELEAGNDEIAKEYVTMAQYVLDYRREFFTEKQRLQFTSLFAQTN